LRVEGVSRLRAAYSPGAMSVLVVLLFSRGAAGAGEPAPGPDWAAEGVAAQELDWVLSLDGQAVSARGRGRAATLPACDRLVLAVEPAALGWHRVELPRVAPARLRAALDGLLEEALLDEPAQLHLALEPGAAPGQAAWVAVLRRDVLAAALAGLEAAGRDADRVVPLWPPGAARRGHFSVGDDPGGQARLEWCAPDGALVLPLRGAAARALAGDAAEPGVEPGVQWSASPAAAAAAERWLGAPVPLLDEGERALRAADSAWELRQFDLAPRRRGARRAAAAWRAWLGPAWRPVRLGLASLVALQVLGLNAWAWQQQRAIAERQQAQQALLRSAHPQVRLVIDAPLQMQRETALLRARAGQVGEADLEAALAAAAAAWPEGQPPVQGLRFETGRLVLTAAAWSETQQRSFRERVRAQGWNTDFAAGRLTLTRAAAAPAGS
jgi:general secretion pathway protein L